MECSSELLLTTKGKPSLVIDGYEHRINRINKTTINWICMKEKKEKCKGRIVTTLQHEVPRKTDHTCLPNVAEIEVKKVLLNCRKRVREETAVPVHRIFQEESATLYDRGYDLISDTPRYESVKSTLCKERREVLGTTQNPQSSAEVNFPEDLLRLPNGENFLRLDFCNTEGKRILVFGGEGAQILLNNGEHFFFDGTFKSSPKQFAQLFTVHADCMSTESETSISAVLFALLPDKKEETYVNLLQNIKTWCPEWKPKLIKMDFEAAVISASRKEFPGTTISGCSFHYTQCLTRKIQEIGLMVQYKEDEEIRRTCRMCSALAYLPLDAVDDGWCFIMSNAPRSEKLSLFLDYFVVQWLDNPNIPIEMWNVCGQRHRTNNGVEGWNSKLNKAVGKNQPNIQLLVSVLKKEALTVSQNLRAKELGKPGEKRKKIYPPGSKD